MDFKTITEIPLKKQFQIKNIIKKANILGLNNINEGPSIVKMCAIIKKLLRCKNPSKVNENVTTLHCEVDYFTSFKHFNKTGTLSFNNADSILCTFEKDGEYDSCCLFYKLSKELQKNKIVFLFIDILNYVTCPLDDGTNTYQVHSVCGIFHPNKQNKYDFLYFNSHGKNVLKYTHYKYKLSQRRIKNIPLPLPMDYYFNQKLIMSLNSYMKSWKYDTYVQYKPSQKFNYQHFNLQSGDSYGICFVFPYIIWYNIMYDYFKPETFNITTKDGSFTFIKQLKIPNAHFLLTKHRLFRFMEKILIHYDKEFKHLVFKNWHKTEAKTIELLESFIEKKGTAFIKNIIYYMISFLGQKKIKDKIIKK